jgi:hypothetical protein
MSTGTVHDFVDMLKERVAMNVDQAALVIELQLKESFREASAFVGRNIEIDVFGETRDAGDAFRELASKYAEAIKPHLFAYGMASIARELADRHRPATKDTSPEGMRQ